MTAPDLLSKPEFWAALFGASAAFLLGALAQWWTSLRQKRAAGNLALITLTQMYSLMENIRQQLLEDEATRNAALQGRDPLTVEIRGMAGLSDDVPRLHPSELGFLLDSHDPDILNRLLTVERAFNTTFSLVRRHRDLHAELQERLSRLDGTGTTPYRIDQLPALVGVPLIIQLDDTVTGLVQVLPDTCSALTAISGQLAYALRMQFPFAMFLEFKVVRNRKFAVLPPGAPRAPLWRVVLHAIVAFLRKKRHLRFARAEESIAPTTKPPPTIKPFPRPRGIQGPQ